MLTLTQQEMDSLQQFLNEGNVAGFYDRLAYYGDPYGRLGLGVTLNNTPQGKLANAFAESAGDRDGVDLSYDPTVGSNWSNLNSALAQRYLDAYVENAGNQPTRQQVQTAHNEEYPRV